MPTLAVAAALKARSPEAELLYVGSLRAEDRRLVEAAGLPFQAIHAGKLRRYLSAKNIADAFNFWRGIKDAARIIRQFHPQVIFAKGGYVSLPVVLAAKRFDIPVIGHESDSFLGLANRWALRSARKLAVAWPVQNYLENEPGLNKYADKFVYTGLPMGDELISWQAKKIFADSLPVILVTGGSQGAHSINEAVWEILPRLLRDFNVAHQTGGKDIGEAKQRRGNLPAELQDRYLPFEFDRDVFLSALHQAELVISRAGSFVFELAVLGKPAILVPLRGSANEHQLKNAQMLADRSAAVMLAPEKFSGEELLSAVYALFADKNKLAEMSQKMKEFGEPSYGAAEKIAKLIIETANEKTDQ